MTRATVALLFVTIAVAGCMGDGGEANRIESPEPGDWDIVPPLFVDEAWPQLLHWKASVAAPLLAQEMGFVWTQGILQRDSKLEDLDVQVVATDVPRPWRMNATLEAPGATGATNLGVYLILEGQTFIMPMQSVLVLARGETHAIGIGDIPLGPLSQWSNALLDIAQGDAVVWQNNDQLEHTATSLSGPTFNRFDTELIAAGEASEPIWFRDAGTSTYRCSLHSTMAPGTIRVAAL